ncbi:Surface polysaccharide O-acyltransferase, integral membrane enzyme [Cohnella sp. OV330]|uniref:acyltransferase n=1 Tax=Cohnella sp. OV330 TaxID=1855288 RepID=UPI0008E2EFBE|nr:acyltransferase [Cohnella sp. OV330]SFB26744.1 Surface polysaccharide O-acyltransferase, integral membrane enzyme [Cohnella sp. OV330]
MTQARRYIPEINLMRAMAILAVVMIHSTSNALVQLQTSSSFYGLYVFLHEFAVFAVPAFIFISGFVLTYNYVGKPLNGGTIATFYRKRIWNAVVPYAIFSLLYFLLKAKFAPAADWAPKFLGQLLTGQAYGHLYFMFVIIQYYVLFPILLLALRSGWVRRHIWWIGIAIQWGYYYLNREYIVHQTGWPDVLHRTGSLFISYFGAFAVAMWMAIHYERILSWFAARPAVRRLSVPFAYALWLLSGFYYVYLRYQGLVHKNWADGQVFTYTQFVFNIMSAIALFLIANVMMRRPAAFWARLLGNIGVCSFGIYFVHPAVLYYYRDIPVPGNGMLFHVYYACEYLAALLVAWGITWTIQRNFRWAWILFGTSSAPKKKTSATP